MATAVRQRGVQARRPQSGPGKTTLLAAVAAAAVDGPLRVPRGEVVVVASSFEQAKILFGDLLAFTGTQGEIDKKTWRKHDTAQRASLEHLPTGCRVKAIASDPRRAHGLRPSLVIADEPAQWSSSTSDAMYAALNTALGKVPGSRLICIGTRPADKTHWFERLLQDADYALCHAAESDDNPFDESTWTKALPQLKRLPHLLKTFKDEAHAAEKDAALLAQFRALRLNMGVSDVVILYLLSPEQWLAAEGLAEPSGPCLWAIDLGATAAMSAVAAYWPDTGRLDAVAAFPSRSIRACGQTEYGRILYCRGQGPSARAGKRLVVVEHNILCAMAAVLHPWRHSILWSTSLARGQSANRVAPCSRIVLANS